MVVDPASMMIFLRLFETVVSADTNRYNAAIRDDIARNNTLTTQLNHEHQKKMLYLQEQFKVQDKWLDLVLRKRFLEDTIANELHKKKMTEIDGHYTRGSFVMETIPDKPVPYIIVSRNPNQKYNPLKELKEVSSIAPLNRVTDTVRQLNSAHEARKLFTILSTNEYFTDEDEVERFYHREINCPCILIYSFFTFESLKINAYISGVYENQRNVRNDKVDLNPRHEHLWDIPISSIIELVAKCKETQKNFQWQSHLSEVTNNLVVLHTQRYLDEFFKYYPLENYESQTLKFIRNKEREEVLKKQFPNLVKQIEEHSESIAKLDKLKINQAKDDNNKFLI